MNINNNIYTAEVDATVTSGKRYVTIIPRGDSKGTVISKHRTRELAERAAHGRDRTIVDLMSLTVIR